MKEKLKSYGIIALGSVIFGLAFDWFFDPNQVAMGGITGLAQVINALLPAIPVGVLTIVLNVPLFIAGWRYIGFHLLASSLFSMAVSSVAIDLIAVVYPFGPMDPMLATLCGGALMGLSLGMVFSQGATTGGTDIVARLLKLRWPWLPLGKLILVPDGVVLALAARVMDTVLYGLDTSKVAYIISDQWEALAQVLLKEQDRGVTILRGQGAYTGRDKQVLMVAFKQRDIVQIKHTVHQLDPSAFLIVCDAHDVLGEGFGDYQKEEI